MNDLLSQALMSLFSGSVVAGVMTFFMKRMISEYDSKHKKTEDSLGLTTAQYHELDKKLISIQSDIRDVAKTKDQIAIQEKSIWALDSQMKAAWRYIDSADKKRASDRDE
ncbi:MAG: hypothetical protein SGI96_21245 [Bacteroidota bacterium]|nr:hypothetical protein [Bacteroidota bacterium]